MFNDKLLIDGKLIEGDARLEVVDPSTGAPFMSVARASVSQLEKAIAAARRAQPGWYALGREGRRARLIALADAMRANADKLTHAVTKEQGKPLAESADELALTEAIIRYFADAELPAESLQQGNGFIVEAHHRPLGVVAGITPWNFPLAPGLGKAAPALILGNCHIWKPAPTTPVSALAIAELARDIFPPGVFSVIVDDNDLGAAITAHPGIDKVSFTGSTATGKKIMKSAADLIKRVTLELGGNDAAIVLDDADVDEIAPRLFGAAFYNAGQVCIAVKRVYAPSSLYGRLCEALAKCARETIVGEGTKKGVQMGPIQNRQQFAKAKGYLESAKADGKVIAGGDTVAGGGFFVQPTIVRDLPDPSRLVQEEQFAPILPVLSYDEVGDAVRRANATPFGLGGSVWTKDVARAREVARQMETGTVWVNQHGITLPHVPFGGAKQSGFGTELGRDGLAEFAQLHVINIAQ